ncbi:hypothetical protein K3152_01250 [Qipengyuania sp. 1NDH17]|uniref:DUF3426 domain-containing protein n=1 Tax=Qipengyuania polymorpha TaxID=2867234 RepID=A0ABS7IXS5_9SPHN|nr:hypothetical protein [Qipengyuania polymorpha]MBX7456865.1 hypothetical protein [Qipengyuania polymorpha]
MVAKDEDGLQKVPKRAPLFGWGAFATAVYLLALALTGSQFEVGILDLKPNELGDFLAGAFSPLAFLWLVLGFLQQGQELRIQAIELNNAVEQSRQLVDVTRSQLDLDRQSVALTFEKEKELRAPQFRLSGGVTMISGNDVKFKYTITNVGGECTDIVLYRRDAEGPMKELRKVDHLRKDSNFEVSLRLDVNKYPSWQFVLQYKDEDGQAHQRSSNVQYEVQGAKHDVRFQ